jgi:hypothetical protein
LLGDYEFENYERNSDRNADTQEHTVGGGMKLDPAGRATLRTSYHFSYRRINGSYQPFPMSPANQFFEWDQLRMFDQAHRERHRVDAYLSVNPLDRLSLGASVVYQHDAYDDNFYGRRKRTAIRWAWMPTMRSRTVPRCSPTTAATTTTARP